MEIEKLCDEYREHALAWLTEAHVSGIGGPLNEKDIEYGKMFESAGRMDLLNQLLDEAKKEWSDKVLPKLLKGNLEFYRKGHRHITVSGPIRFID